VNDEGAGDGTRCGDGGVGDTAGADPPADREGRVAAAPTTRRIDTVEPLPGECGDAGGRPDCQSDVIFPDRSPRGADTVVVRATSRDEIRQR
jgi:hypothetical protein